MTGYTFNQLFDFTRTTSGTFVGSNGLLQTTPASANLLTFTQEFDNAAWTKSAVTVTANSIVAPDGTSTADTILATGTASAGLVRSFASTTAAYTFSVYLKQGNTTFSEIEMIDQGTVANRVRLTYATGVLSVVSGSPTGTATNVGNGWWRVTITYTFPAIGAADTLVVYPSTTTGSIGENVFAWGAQLELGSTATTYARNNGGLFPPRFEYDPVTRAPRGFLIEEQRTNLIPYSDQFDNAAWFKSGITVATNAATSPDGSGNAEAITENTATTTHQLFQNANFTSGVAYTASIYVKQSVGTRRLNIALTSGAFGIELYATYNLSTLAIAVSAGVTASMENVGNGWYRCRMTATATATSSAGFVFRLADGDAATFYAYTGDGTSTLLLYGAQLEVGTFATSYIPTVASQVTRSADVCNINAPMFAPWFNQNEGTFVVDSDVLFATITSKAAITTNDGTSNNINIVYVASSATIACEVRSGGALTSALYPGTAIANVPIKTATAYGANNFAASSNGAAVSTDTSGAVALNQSELNVGYSRNYGGLQINGHIRRITYYPFRASNNQLQALST